MVLTLTTTIYRRVEVPVTRYVVSRYRIVSHYATRLDVDYYDDAGVFWTRVSYPTRYLKNVVTEFVGVTERVEKPRELPQPVPVPPHLLGEVEEKRGVRVPG